MILHTPRSLFKSVCTFIVALVATTLVSTVAYSQNFSKTFTVPADTSSIEVINQMGSIKVSSASAGSRKIVINARQSGDAKIDASQLQGGKVKIEVTGMGKVEFEITVPQATNIDLLSYKGTIEVSNIVGEIKARITKDGDLTFTGIRSKKVNAHGYDGNINFSGELLDGGVYTLKSFSGRVDATFPADADFKLSASSFSGVLDLGGFPMKFDRQTNQLVEATSGAGRATVKLWSQEGNIYLHRKP